MRKLANYELPLFFLLTYLLSWWAAPLANGQLIPHGPTLAAIIVLAVTGGRGGLRVLWDRIAHRRVAWYWYLIGPAIVAGYMGAAAAINLALGAEASGSPALSWGLFLELVLLGGMWEEPGWTGYALPRLEEKFSGRPNGVLSAILLLGALRAIWHIPLWVYGHIPWFDVMIFAVVFQIIIAWLYHRSGGSVLVVMAFHLASNVVSAAMRTVFTGTAWTSYYIVFVALAAVVALVALRAMRTIEAPRTEVAR